MIRFRGLSIGKGRALRAIATETGQSHSNGVRQKIREYLGKTEVESVQSMSQRLAKLERQLKKLAQLVTS